MDTVQIRFSLTDDVSGGLKKMLIPLEDVQKAVKEVSNGVENAKTVFGKLTDRLITVQTIGSALCQVGEGLGQMASPAMDFQQRMADLSAITGVVGEELDEVAGMARRIGRESGLGASEAARAFSVLAGQLDAPVEDIGLILEKSATLAQAAGLTIDDAANSLAATISQYGLAAEYADRIMNVLAAGSRVGASEVVDLAQSFKVVGAAASSLGVDVEHTAGALEVLGGANIKGAEAGTALRNVLLSLKTKLGVDTSVTDLSDALAALQPRLQDTEFLAKTFGVANVTAATYLIQNAEAVRKMTAAVSDTQAAQEQAEIRNATWAHSVETMRAAIDDVKIGIGSSLGSVGALSQVLVENASSITSVVEMGSMLGKAFTTVRAGLASLVGWIGKTAVAQRVAAVATRAWAGVQKVLNVVMAANPIGLVVAAIGLLVAGVVMCIRHFETWGETVLECLGPIGWVIASVVRHWESLKSAFSDGGMVAGLKRIGEVLMDALLHPVQKLLGWVAELTGWDWAKKASEWVQEVRVEHRLTEGESQTADVSSGAAEKRKEGQKSGGLMGGALGGSLGLGTATGGVAATATAQAGQIKRIDITIDKVVENFTVSTTNMQQAAGDVRDMVARALVDAVNDVNYAL